ncbi:MAG: glycosyltransferase family 4 protein [Alphaproteobacteria bacterium]
MNNKNKPIVLQVLPSLISGGVERGTIDIAKALSNNNYTSFVASAGGKLVSNLDKLRVKHFTLSLNSKNPFKILLNSFYLAKLIEEHNINIIHARSRAPAWSAFLAAKITGIKFVTSFHGIYKFNNIFKKFYNSIMTKGEKVIAVSNYVKNHILDNYNIPEEKIELIHRGVDLEYFNKNNIDLSATNSLKKLLQLDYDLPIISLPGRLTRWKGQLFLLNALKLLPENSFFCLIVGDDKGHKAYRIELQKFIDGKNLSSNVKIVENITDIPNLYAISNIVVSTSLEGEAFGRVAVEAQAMGCLTIATNIGGAKETIINNKTGWLVTPNDFSMLASTIENLLNIPFPQQEIYTRAAREHICENFSLDQMTSKTIALYNSLL